MAEQTLSPLQRAAQLNTLGATEKTLQQFNPGTDIAPLSPLSNALQQQPSAPVLGPARPTQPVVSQATPQQSAPTQTTVGKIFNRSTAAASAGSALKETGRFFLQDVLGIGVSREVFEDQKPGVVGIGTNVANLLATPFGALAESTTELLTGQDVEAPRLPGLGEVGIPTFTPEETQSFVNVFDPQASFSFGDVLNLLTSRPGQLNLAALDLYIGDVGRNMNKQTFKSLDDFVQTVTTQSARQADLDALIRPVDLDVDLLIKQVDEALDPFLVKPLDEIGNSTDILLRTLPEGVTAQQARNQLDNLVRTDVKVETLDSALARLRVERDALLKTQTDVASQAIKGDIQRLNTSIIPAQLDNALQRIDTIQTNQISLLDNALTTSSRIPTVFGQTIDNILTPVLSKLRADTGADPSDILASVREADAALKTLSPVAREPIDELVTTLEEQFLEIANDIDELVTLRSSVENNGAAIRAAGLTDLAERSGLRVKAATEGQSLGRINQQIGTLETRLAEAQAKSIELRNSPITALLQRAKDLGVDETSVISTRRLAVEPKVALETFDTPFGKDIRALARTSIGLTDPTRVAQRADGAVRGPRMTEFVEPAIAAKANYQANMNIRLNAVSTMLERMGMVKPGDGLYGWLKKKASPKAKKSIDDSARMFRVAERRATPEDLKKLTPDQQRFVDFTRAYYDNTLEKLNIQRKELGHKAIPKRKNYVTHLQEMTFFDSMGKNLVSEPDPNAFFRSQRAKSKTSFRFEKSREGDIFDEDIIASVQSYITIAEKELAMNPVAARIQSLIPFLPGKNERAYWEQWVKEAVLDGQTSLDQMFDNFSPFAFTNLFAKFSGITSRGALLANVNVAFLQPSTIFLNPTKAGMKSSIIGTAEAVTKQGEKFVIDNSALRSIRGFEKNDLLKRDLTKVENALASYTGWLDLKAFDTTWLSMYRRATDNMGATHDDAVKLADLTAGQVQAMYDKLLTPTLLRSKTGRLVGQFGTFPINLWNSLTTDLANQAFGRGEKIKATRNLIGSLAAMQVANISYGVLGLRQPFEFVSTDRKEIAGVIPLIGNVRTFGPPLAFETALSGLSLVSAIYYGDERQRDNALEELGKNSKLLIPGGNQLVKTMGGIASIENGFTRYGNEKIPIEGTVEQIRALLNGPYGTKAAQDFFDEQRRQEIEDRKNNK